MRVSEIFDLKKSQHELDFVDVDIDSDTPLFLDPYFIANNDFPIAYEAHLSLRSYFACLLGALRENKLLMPRNFLAIWANQMKSVLVSQGRNRKEKEWGPQMRQKSFRALWKVQH